MYISGGTPLCAFDVSPYETKNVMIEESTIWALHKSTDGLVIIFDVVIIIWSNNGELLRFALVDEHWIILIFNEVINTGYLIGSFDGYNDGNI